ncbi:MAG: septum formation initiator family protein [Micavibrio aeruginosavorus]|uniref:Septum formation initiator family protein n=1 Tax=Micavibrio aeruginosavorus TaxID=349221 RepID=A0A7T5R0S7_9BACT|nr:MAG: septum formation initiator family protein [Micavibrio aeruginosavorus]
MRKLLGQRYVVKDNFLAIIGICLSFYFTYHMISGERSYFRLMALERSVERLDQQYESLHKERAALENKVAMMRPGSIDPDLLEERARAMLGYQHPDELIVIRAQ